MKQHLILHERGRGFHLMLATNSGAREWMEAEGYKRISKREAFGLITKAHHFAIDGITVHYVQWLDAAL